jgi:hypothetical protein
MEIGFTYNQRLVRVLVGKHDNKESLKEALIQSFIE